MIDLVKIKELTKMPHSTIQDKLNSETCEYQQMSQCFWDLVDTLMGGTKVIQAQSKKYLPQFHDECDNGYKDRLSKSFLLHAYKNTIKRHSGRPFAEPVQVNGLTDARLMAIEKDVNMEGQDLTSFSKNFYKDAENHGLSYTLVDMPSTGGDGSVAGDQAGNIRPRFIHIPAPCLYYWNDAIINNVRQLTEIIYKDEEKRYRWTRDVWEVYRKAGKEESRQMASDCGNQYLLKDSYWIFESGGVNELGEIPLVVNYFNRINWMFAEPCLYGLAEQNLQYYQIKSDYDSIARFSMTGMLHAKGFTNDEADNISVGANKVVVSQAEGSELKIIEYTGSSTQIGQDSLRDLKSDMEVAGARPELKSSVDSTATGIVVNNNEANSDLKVWACVTEDALERCYAFAAQWLGVELADDFEVIIYKEFTIAGRTEDIALLITAVQARGLSPMTLIDEMKLRGLISPKVDTQDELDRIENGSQTFDNF